MTAQAATTAPDQQSSELSRPSAEPTRLVEFALGSLALITWVPAGAPAFAALGLAAVLLLIALAALRPARTPLSQQGLGWLVPLFVVVAAYLVAVSLASPDLSLAGWDRRVLRLAIVSLFLIALVVRRLHYPSLVRGMAVGLVVNAVLFFAGLAPARYGEYLSGYLLDKNQAGLIYVVVGLLLVGLQPGTRRRVLVLVLTAALVWATGSRTSMAALAVGVIWLLLGPRLARFGRVLLAGALLVLVRVLESDYAQVGVFADRFGTDALRARIDDAAWLVVQRTPPEGLGLGEAYVFLEDRVFLFHNSYWSAFVEGGWVFVTFYVVIHLVVGAGVLRERLAPAPWVAASAANVAVLVCATSLGEVFGTTVAMVALAASLLGQAAARADLRDATERLPGRGARPSPERLRRPVATSLLP